MFLTVIASFPGHDMGTRCLVFQIKDVFVRGHHRSEFVHEYRIEATQYSHQSNTGNVAKGLQMLPKFQIFLQTVAIEWKVKRSEGARWTPADRVFLLCTIDVGGSRMTGIVPVNSTIIRRCVAKEVRRWAADRIPSIERDGTHIPRTQCSE
jgi:hypothetical protein